MYEWATTQFTHKCTTHVDSTPKKPRKPNQLLWTSESSLGWKSPQWNWIRAERRDSMCHCPSLPWTSPHLAELCEGREHCLPFSPIHFWVPSTRLAKEAKVSKHKAEGISAIIYQALTMFPTQCWATYIISFKSHNIPKWQVLFLTLFNKWGLG